MNNTYISPFNNRQIMHRPDFELFHYIDSSPCNVSLHHHDFFEIYFPLNNSMEYVVEGRRYLLRSGNLLLIAPHELHHPAPENIQSFERFVLWLSPSYLNTLADLVPNPMSVFSMGSYHHNLIISDDEHAILFTRMFNRLMHECTLNDPDTSVMRYTLITQLFVYIKRLLMTQPSVDVQLLGESPRLASRHPRLTTPTPQMRDVFEYINSHLCEDLTLHGIADHFFFDINTLSRKFKRHTGITVCDYIRKKRLAVARLRIIQGEGAAQAGARSGFSDYSTFYRAFKNEYGVSPKAFSLTISEKEPSFK